MNDVILGWRQTGPVNVLLCALVGVGGLAFAVDSCAHKPHPSAQASVAADNKRPCPKVDNKLPEGPDCTDSAHLRKREDKGPHKPPPHGAMRAGWDLVWWDDFDGKTLDPKKWTHVVNGTGGGNNELQYYTSREKNAYVANGVLTIQAHKEHYCDTDGCREYTSARLRTFERADWLYGRMEVRAKLPAGQGLWPAVWMLPSEWAYGTWAASGEIDIVEAINAGAAGGNNIYGTLHYGGKWPDNVHKGGKYTPATSITESFHTYAVEWEPTQMRFYVDDILYYTPSEWTSSSGPFPAPFDKRFHMVMNVAVGGNWPGSPDAATTFPQQMDVDYVRVYQKRP